MAPSQAITGTLVTITGTNFTGATSVRFNGIPADGYSVVSATQIKAYVPSAATTGRVVVYTPAGGDAVSPLAFTVLSSITSLSSYAGSSGSTITISGVGFTGATSVKVGDTSATFTVTNSTTISMTVPNGVDGFVSVTTSFGTVYSAKKFYYAPQMVRFSPVSGPVGTVVGITMNANVDLSNPANVQVTLNGAAVPVQSTDTVAHIIYVTIPAGASTGSFSVITPGGTAIGNSTFTVTP